jgi:hypothetical protein
MAYPYFIENTLALCAIGVAGTVALSGHAIDPPSRGSPSVDLLRRCIIWRSCQMKPSDFRDAAAAEMGRYPGRKWFWRKKQRPP